MKNQEIITLFSFLMCFSFLINTLCCETSQAEVDRTRDVCLDEEINVGVIVDMNSWQGKVMESSFSMALADFYSLDKPYKSRIVLHMKDSQGDPFGALSAAIKVLEDAKVAAILGAQKSMEAKFLAEFAERNQIPLISFSTPNYSSYPISTRTRNFYLQVSDDQTSQIKGIAALVELHKWRNVILIHQEDDVDDLTNRDDIVSFMASLFEEKNIHISFRSAFAASSEDDQIVDQLHELKSLQTTVFIMHLSHSLASRLFVIAKRLGMISKGYAWIVTSKCMNHFNSDDFSAIESMRGAIGFRSYIPATEEVQIFSSRLRREFYVQEGSEYAMQFKQLKLGLLAYDVAWSLAEAAEMVAMKVPSTSNLTRSNLSDAYGSLLLDEIIQSNFKGLGGEFRFISGKLISNTYEIVNVIRSGAKRVGFCTLTGRIKREISEPSHRRQLNNLESIIWPGDSSTVPQGRMLQTSGNILKIGVPVRTGFPQLVKVTRDPDTNATAVTGFCIDVFKAAVEGLSYQVMYEFIPFMDANGNSAGTYNELVYQVYLQKFDAVVGDTTITSSRSLYVDFTTAYTDIGEGIVASTENKDVWIIFKPLTLQLWLSIFGFHIVIGLLLWLIELQSTNRQADQEAAHRRTMFYTILVGRWEQLRNQWATFIAAISLFVLFIVSSSYTATLSSMMTVQHIELNSGRSYIGYRESSVATKGVFTNNLNFENHTLKPFQTAEDYANALSKGSKNGGVSAILDEIPYIKIFLAEYSAEYSLVKTLPTTNGFAFVFPKGSPLVPDISREIARLRESGRLEMLENAWFKSQTLLRTGDTEDNVRPLTPTNFGGLFLISGTLVFIVFLIFQISFLYHYSLEVRNWMTNGLTVWRQVLAYFMKGLVRFWIIRSATIYPQVQMTSEVQQHAT